MIFQNGFFILKGCKIMGIIQLGRASLSFEDGVELFTSACIVGQEEKKGPLGDFFQNVCEDEDALLGKETWEEAESELQKRAVELTLEKASMTAKDIRYLLGGDLLGQTIASSFGILDFEIPFFGLFGACSTCAEGLCLASILIAGNCAKTVMSLTSSHYASAQKEFRFPIEYGGQRPLYASWTVTGSAAFILRKKEDKCEQEECSQKIVITGITPGKIVDYGIKDSFNMGCAMAPAACDTIMQNFKDFHRSAKDYDAIITGDLGSVGQQALFELLMKQNIDISDRHYDCGMLIFDAQKQDVHAGGSGCGCAASVLSAYIIPKMREGKWRRILFLPTGALLNKTSFNEGQNVPGISHGVVLECM